LVCATSWSAADCWAAVGVPEGTGAITMPLDMTFAPFTLAHTVDVVCAAPDDDDDDDDDDDEVAIFMPAIDPELPAALVPGVTPLDADALDAGCDEASETVVAPAPGPRATPTVTSPAHHSRAARRGPTSAPSSIA